MSDLYAVDEQLASEAVETALVHTFDAMADDDVKPLELLAWAAAAVLTLALSAAGAPA